MPVDLLVHDTDPSVERRLGDRRGGAVAASAALLIAAFAGGLALSPVHLLVPLATVLALEAGDLYDRDDLVLRRSTLDEAPALLQFAAVATIAAAIIGGKARSRRRCSARCGSCSPSPWWPAGRSPVRRSAA